MSDPVDPDGGEHEDPAVTCELQGGTVCVYEDRVEIERSKRSMHEDKTIPADEIEGVEYSKGFVTGHIQIRQVEMDHGSGGVLSHPVDENTLYFPRNRRSGAREARDAILARARGSSAERGPDGDR
jgi:hypothetical protein